MNSLDRIRATAARQQPDVVPAGPYVANHAAHLAGMTLCTYCTNGKEMARALLEALERYQYDTVFPDCDNYYLAEGLGCETRLPEDDIAELIRSPLPSLDRVVDMPVPDPKRDGRMPVVLEAIETLVAQVGDTVAIRAPGTGPFSLASYLIGMQTFLLELAKIERGFPDAHPEAIHQLLDLTTRALIAFGEAEIDAGAHIIQCGDSLASINVISPRMYETYAFPHQQRVFRAWKAKGAITLLHICGNSTRVLDLYAQTGADIVELDSRVDLRVAKQRIGDKVCLCGNVNPVELLQGSPADVEHAARECAQAAAAGGGFILGSGCEVPISTPPENIRTFVKTSRQYTYPLTF